MKYILVSSLLFILVFVYSCATPSYNYSNEYGNYQVQEFSSSDVNVQTMIYEDSTVIIKYDLWSQSGSTKSLLYNKSDSSIFVNIELSHLILNKIAYPLFDLYLKETRTTVSTSSTHQINDGINSLKITESSSLGYVNNGKILIPPHSAKYIPGYSIAKFYPSPCNENYNDSINYLFSKESTPYEFSNLIYYSIGDSKKHKVIRNSFWVSRIVDLEWYKFYHRVYTDECGISLPQGRLVTYWIAPNRLFIKS